MRRKPHPGASGAKVYPMRPRAALWLLATAMLGRGAHAATRDRQRLDIHVARYRTSNGVLVVSREPSLATVTVCASPFAPLSEPDALAVARRGGVVVHDGNAGCITTPASDLSLSARLIRHFHGAATKEEAAPAVSSPRGESLTALARVALEGVDASGTAAPARVVAVVGPAPELDVARLFVDGPPVTLDEIRQPVWTVHQSSERLSVVEAPLARPAVRYGWVVPAGTVPEEAALKIAVGILGVGRLSRMARVVEDRGLARRAEAWNEKLRGGLLVGVWLELSTRVSADRVRRFVDGTIGQLRLVGPSRREVARARATAVRTALERWENPEARARELVSSEATEGSATRVAEEIPALASVAPDAVRAVARLAFRDERRTTLEMYPPLWPTDDPAVAHHTLYTIGQGDTLTGVAERFHVTVESLARSNDLDPKGGLMAGQPLWIPSE